MSTIASAFENCIAGNDLIEERRAAHEGLLEALIAKNMPVGEFRLSRLERFDLDRLFAFGLKRLLDGLSVFVAEQMQRSQPRR